MKTIEKSAFYRDYFMYIIDNNILAKQISDLSNTDHRNSCRNAAAGIEQCQANRTFHDL